MRLPRLRKPRPADLIRVNGHWHIVHSWTTDDYTELRSLGDMLASNLVIDSGSMLLADALLDAGWSPPKVDDKAPLPRPLA